MSTIEIPLKHTITSATGEKISKLTLIRPTRKDLKLAQKHSKDEVEMEDLLFSRLTGLPVEDLDLLDIEDNTQLTNCFRRMQRGSGGSPEAAGRNSATGSEDPTV
jgi:hypothetical protein